MPRIFTAIVALTVVFGMTSKAEAYTCGQSYNQYTLTSVNNEVQFNFHPGYEGDHAICFTVVLWAPWLSGKEYLEAIQGSGGGFSEVEGNIGEDIFWRLYLLFARERGAFIVLPAQ